MLKSFYRNNEKSISRKEGDKIMYKKIQNFTKVITTEFVGGMKGGKSYHLTPNPCLVFADKRASNGFAIDSCTPAKIRSP